MEQSSASQPSQETPQHTPGPWRWKPAPWGGRQWLVPEYVDPASVGPDYQPILDADPSGGEYFPAHDLQVSHRQLEHRQRVGGLLDQLGVGRLGIECRAFGIAGGLTKELGELKAQIAAAEGRDAE